MRCRQGLLCYYGIMLQHYEIMRHHASHRGHSYSVMDNLVCTQKHILHKVYINIVSISAFIESQLQVIKVIQDRPIDCVCSLLFYLFLSVSFNPFILPFLKSLSLTQTYQLILSAFPHSLPLFYLLSILLFLSSSLRSFPLLLFSLPCSPHLLSSLLSYSRRILFFSPLLPSFSHLSSFLLSSSCLSPVISSLLLFTRPLSSLLFSSSPPLFSPLCSPP